MFEIYELRVSHMEHPLGLDEKSPVFSWKLKSDAEGTLQKQAQILVSEKTGEGILWDSGVMETDVSIGISYEGKELKPETEYTVQIRAWNQDGKMAEGETWFETGLLNPDISAWDGAKWIGAPEYLVAPEKLSVFVLEETVAILKGNCAGIVFGANDARLLDKRKNEQQVEGENDIRIVLNVGCEPAAVEIYRRGYCKEDRPDVPLAVFPAVDSESGKELITPENRTAPHKLKAEVTGNCVNIYLDGMRLSPTEKKEVFLGDPRCVQLNPLGRNDVTTYPRLCQIGCFVEAGSTAEFSGLRVSNLRKPCAEIYFGDLGENRILTGDCLKLVDPSCHSLPMLRRNFSVKGKVAKARLYATARGIYECSINGQRVGDEYFAPGASQFDYHLMYQTYDVTDLVTEGENGIGCILASGWWSDGFSFRLDNYNYWGDQPSFLGRLVITYTDGRKETTVTDETAWDYFGEGPYLYAGFFNGETYDARREKLYQDFSRPDFRVEGMKKPQVIVPVRIEEKEGIFPGACPWPAVNTREPELVGNYQAPVREAEILSAVSMTEPVPGLYIYDLGQEIAGVPLLTLHGRPGQKITIRYGEILYPELEEYQGLWGQMLQANLREASNIDVYYCKGGEEEIYKPRFTFHGFRYIEISGVDQAPELCEVKGVLLSSVEKITGEFHCDNELVNRFVKNVCYSQYCNFISIPTDCPQRNERMGWLGDTHIFCRTATYQSDVKNFYLRNLQAVRDMQREDGRLPSIAPFGGGFGGQTYESALILMVWELYQQYGDRRIAEEYYPAMDRWMDSMKAAGLPGIIPGNGFPAWLGDWLAPEPADDNLIFNAFHYRNARIMEKLALLLGKEEDAEKYRRTAETAGDFWNRTFVDAETGITKNADGSRCDVQGSYSIGLSCGVFAEKVRKMAYAHLERTTREAGYTIQSGFFGTGPINPMLSEGGYPEAAGKTMTQTACPSWLYPVTQGATTIWERWNSFTRDNGFGGNNSMNSFNHYSLGSVLSWLYENILGIKRDEQHPGYQHFTLKPEMGTFAHAEGGIDTPHGRIESAYKKTETGYEYRCRIPANTTATLILGAAVRELGSGEYCFEI